MSNDLILVEGSNSTSSIPTFYLDGKENGKVSGEFWGNQMPGEIKLDRSSRISPTEEFLINRRSGSEQIQQK